MDIRIGIRVFALAICTFAAGLSRGEVRDGSHDFDFNLGTWHTSIERTLDPFAAAPRTLRMEGTVRVRPVWGGRAQLEEIEADGPNGHWQGLTLFIYNPRSGQWSQGFANSANGSMAGALVGSFSNGRGELLAQDTLDGRSILVRGTWSDITPSSHTYTEAYSDDGGRTWHTAFRGLLTKAANAPTPPASEGSREFDFDAGVWKTHTRRLLHPLAGGREWVELEGITRVSKVWNGRANLAEYKAEDAAGKTLELLSLRLYNPQSKQWALHFTNPGSGTFGLPNVGAFSGERGDFYSFEEIEGRYVMVRFSMWPITKDTARSEQAFSTDGGKTWEVNWTNDYTRVAPDAPAKP